MKFEIIRAFPHVTEVAKTGNYLTLELPFLQIGRPIQYCTSCIIGPLSSYNAVIVASFCPDFRVPKMICIAVRNRVNNWLLFLHDSSVLVHNRNTLVRVSYPVLITCITGIHQIQLIVLLNGTSRVSSVGIIGAPRLQANPNILPMYQIFGLGVIPILQSMLRPKREPLIEQVVFPLIVSKSIRVIKKSCARLYMEGLSPRTTAYLFP
ncbi:hypothetical protein D3C81_1075050 [compost metagenome]